VTDVFLSGALCHAPLLSAVIGRSPELRSATLLDYSLIWSEDHPAGWVEPAPGQQVAGCVATDLSESEAARLGFYAEVLGLTTQAVDAIVGGTPVRCRLWSAPAPRAGLPWDEAAYLARWAGAVTATAGDIMAHYGRRPAADLRGRTGPMLVRGASRARAGGGATALRRRAQAQDVEVIARRQPYAAFFAVEEYDLRFRRFDGSMSPVVSRAIFISGDAVTVLPYDPVRDRVLLIEQFRAAVHARGDDQPWLLEVIAGRVDPGETPQQAARREAVEEAGLSLGELLEVASYYPSPGAKAEYLYSYVALTDLPDGTAGTFGLATEAENIRSHLISFDQLMALVRSGEAANAPLILTALWLERERGRLRR
jgi:nudix-type nucleoside diphosphatase (YffH/AdpP family)